MRSKCPLQKGKHNHDENDAHPVISGRIREMVPGEVIYAIYAIYIVKLPNVIMNHVFYDIQYNEDAK
jgi:hypothetical protein